MKLKRIQKELQALDDMVSADIGILRNRIDQASLEYSCARWVERTLTQQSEQINVYGRQSQELSGVLSLKPRNSTIGALFLFGTKCSISLP